MCVYGGVHVCMFLHVFVCMYDTRVWVPLKIQRRLCTSRNYLLVYVGHLAWMLGSKFWSSQLSSRCPLLLSLQSSPFFEYFLIHCWLNSLLRHLGEIQIQLDDLSAPHVLTGCQKNEEGDVLILYGNICSQDPIYHILFGGQVLHYCVHLLTKLLFI